MKYITRNKKIYEESKSPSSQKDYVKNHVIVERFALAIFYNVSKCKLYRILRGFYESRSGFLHAD